MKKAILALALIFGVMTASTTQAGLGSWISDKWNSAKSFVGGFFSGGSNDQPTQ